MRFIEELFNTFTEVHYFTFGVAVGIIVSYLFRVIKFRIEIMKNNSDVDGVDK